MRPSKLYIENFMCYDKSYIDFSQFNSALIVGKMGNNDLFSNGVGKTTIFKAIEYVLFNQSDVNLEKIIRDDVNYCRIVFDFIINKQEYRISRSRTKKGTTDLILLQRNSVDGSEYEVYHDKKNIPFFDKKDTDKYWKDLSGSRAGDTEKDLAKLLKINAKSFRSTVHFLQNDLSGLSTATPEKRKAILKDALNLIVYSKLEKIAKEKFLILSKEVDKIKINIENLGTPEKDIENLNASLKDIEQKLAAKNKILEELNLNLNTSNNLILLLNNKHSTLESKFANLIVKQKEYFLEKSKLENSIKEYTSKKNNLIKYSKDLIEELAILKKEQNKLINLDYSQIDILTNQISLKKEEVMKLSLKIKDNLEKCEELKIPLPKDSFCKNCRQTMTEQHKKECKEKNIKDLNNFQKEIESFKNETLNINAQIIEEQKSLNKILFSKQELEDINVKILNKEKELQDKKSLHSEYNDLYVKFTNELSVVKDEIAELEKELKNSSKEEADILISKITKEKNNYNVILQNLSVVNKEITHYNSNKAVIEHTLEQKKKDDLKKSSLSKELLDKNKLYSTYPLVIKSFSSTGIPNIIIQNVLDDLQSEANNLLLQLKPGLQISFFIEKTQDDGTEVDTLDIKYQINGKERYYEQLSGAMRLAVTFSLKLGLSFVLQKMIGMNVEFLLLDEIDQSLDKASVDAFADIVKFFQKDFVILVITHNDRLKDKFSHAILVEQDTNMVSTAKVVSSW